MAKKKKGVPKPSKTLLERILEWSEADLALWQRDALRRLFQSAAPDLSVQDYDELYSMMKEESGVPGDVVCAPVPLASVHLPSTSTAEKPVILKALRDLQHVNRIAFGQTMSFSPSGLTVIYGANGSGKSGYSRVMKRACRSRDQFEPVHTDATDMLEQDCVPEAVFDVEIDGDEQPIAWKLGDPSPDLLASIAVFDGRCARIYLTSENDVAYLPYGLDIVESLAQRVLPRIEQMLMSEVAALNTDTSPFDALRGPTLVGSEIAALGIKTDEAKLRSLSTLDTAEFERLSDLNKTLSEGNPRVKATQLRLTAQRITSLIDRMSDVAGKTSQDQISRFSQLDVAVVAAERAAKAAAEAFRAGEALLPGTGDEAWKSLFEAARRYSTEVAYAGHDFPHVADGALCPLCQQDIEGARGRLQRFENFIKQDTGKAVERTRKDLAAEFKPIGAPFSVRLEPALSVELDALEAESSDKVRMFEAEAEACRRAILEAASAHDWSTPKPIATDPRSSLAARCEDIVSSATALDAAANEETRKKLEDERDELAAREALKPSINSVCSVVTNIKREASLEACKKGLSTKAISNKSKELASEAVTKALKTGLDREFAALGVGHIDTKLNERTDKGKMKHRLSLAVPAAKKVEEILSEGEQRAVAIGAFLAELDLAQHRGAVIFDDPVSSLDHQRKGKIAQRLAEKATERQVIVLTHDLVFLNMLIDESERIKSSYLTHWLQQDATGRPGSLAAGEAPAPSKAYRDTKRARATMARAQQLAGDERLRAIRQGMGELRTTLEEVVRYHLFKDVVGRWRENLMITKLKTINWDIVLIEEIDRAMADLSRHIEGHSHTEEYTGGVPDLDDLKSMVDRVDDIIKKARPERTS